VGNLGRRVRTSMALGGLNTALGVGICKLRSIPRSSCRQEPHLKKADADQSLQPAADQAATGPRKARRRCPVRLCVRRS
jgi:hypothetical protein